MELRTAVAYSRFSDIVQKDRSIDDQEALCVEIAKRHGLKIVRFFRDRAKVSTSTLDRDGLAEMMMMAKKRGFSAVVVESLDRISRDQEDLAGVFKRLRFAEIDIFDVKGKVTEIDVGVRGIMGPIFMTDLSNKVRRGMNGLVREGRFPTPAAYGYRAIAGKPGEREIDKEQAKIVRRIFEEFATGKSTRSIARDLMNDGIPSPNGGTFWNHQGIGNGRAGRERGMIGNQIYIGKLIWNATRTVRNPETGKKEKRRADPSEIITMDAPHLRIIDQNLFDRANGIHQDRKPHVRQRQRRTLKDDMLSGLLCCGKCGSHMRIASHAANGAARVSCAAAGHRLTCEHKSTYDLEKLKRGVLEGIKANLTNTKALVEYTRAYHARWAERQSEVRAERDVAQRDLNRVTMQIDRLVTALSDSTDPIPGIMERLKKFEAERIGLTERLRLIDAETGGADKVVDLHPKVIETFRKNIEQMHDALSVQLDGNDLAPFYATFRNVFQKIVVHPIGRGKPYEVTPFVRVSAILGVELFQAGRTADEMLAEQGVGNCDNGHPGKPGRFCFDARAATRPRDQLR
jgi:DNA invertase Pin-like site-specific DNA recombinase